MRGNVADEDIQHYGCWALANLLAETEEATQEQEASAAALAEDGGHTTVLEAMGAHSSNIHIQQYGCEVTDEGGWVGCRWVGHCREVEWRLVIGWMHCCCPNYFLLEGWLVECLFFFSLFAC